MLGPTALAIKTNTTYDGNSFLLPNIVRDIRKFLKNSTFSGYDVTNEMEEEIRNLVPTLKFYCKSQGSFTDFVRQENLTDEGISSRMLFSELYKRGIMPIDQAIDRLMRPILFLRIFSSEVKARCFNTEEIRKRYSKIWEHYKEQIPQNGIQISEEEITNYIKKNENIIFYDFSLKTPIESDLFRGSFMRSVLDQFDLGAPSLNIPLSMIYGIIPALPREHIESEGFNFITSDNVHISGIPNIAYISSVLAEEQELAAQSSNSTITNKNLCIESFKKKFLFILRKIFRCF
jgi:hypothetical protein